MADVIEQGTLVELKERRRLVNNVANHGHPQPRLPVSVDASNQQKLNDYRNRPTTRRHEPSPSHHAPHQPGPHQQVPRCQCCCWTFHPPTTAVPATPTHLSSNNNTLPQLRVSYPPSKTLSWLSTSTVATTSNPSLSMPGMQSTIPRLVSLSILDLFSCRTDRFGIITAFCSRHTAYSRPQDLPHRGSSRKRILSAIFHQQPQKFNHWCPTGCLSLSRFTTASLPSSPFSPARLLPSIFRRVRVDSRIRVGNREQRYA